MESGDILFYTGKGEPYRHGYQDKRNTNDRLPEATRPSKDSQGRHNSNNDTASVKSSASLDSTGKRKSFARVMTRFAEKTSMQGVPYINNAKLPVAKIVWSIMLVLAIGMMGVHLWYLCDQFFAYPKVTKISLDYSNLRFPTVTICNTNPMHKGRFDRYEGAEQLKDLVEDLKPENLVPDQFRPEYDPTNPDGAGQNAPPGSVSGSQGVTIGAGNQQGQDSQTTAKVSGQPTQALGSYPNQATGQSTQAVGSNPNQVTGQPTQAPGTNSNQVTGQPTQAPGSNSNQVTGQPTQKPGTSSNRATGQTTRKMETNLNGQTNGQPQPPPQWKRRKRFIEETKGLDISKYDPNFVEPDETRTFKEGEFNADVDQTTKLDETFKALYMDINSKDRAFLGHNISTMLLACTFEGRQCNSSFDPDPHFSFFVDTVPGVAPFSMFRLVQTAKYGNCWTLDNSQFKVGTSGPSGALSLTMYLEATEYLDAINHGYGLRLLVHEPGTFPFPVEEGHYVSASFETNVGLKMISIGRESEPYGECDPTISENFEQQFKWGYTRRACQTGCLIEAVVGACGCYDDTTEELAKRKNNTLGPCRSPTQRRCNQEVMLQFNRKELSCHCPVPCTETAYEKSFSSRQWPSDSYAMVLLEGVCKYDPVVCKTIRGNLDDQRAISYNFLKLNIYYEDLNFEKIDEEPEIETAQFVSDVGGAVGLWIGLSLLSLCEIAQLIAELCDYAFHKATRNKRPERRRNPKSRERRYMHGDERRSDSHSEEHQGPYRHENGIGHIQYQQDHKDTSQYSNESWNARTGRRW